MSRAAVLSGLGTHLPADAVDNEQLQVRGSSDEWIRTRTGIGRRHFTAPDTSTSDLAVPAGARALASAGTSSVDVVVLATTTPDRPCPATAPLVAARLGLVGAMAFDVSAVCSGFVYALATAAGLIAADVAGTALVVGAETYSGILDPDDRATSVIFGDGAGAVVLRGGAPDEPGALMSFDLGSDGRHSDLITIRAGGSEQRLSSSPPGPSDHYFSMAGKEVFTHAVSRMSESVSAVLGRTGWAVDTVDHLVGHQANIRILNNVADRVGIPRKKSITNLDRVGNTSAASIPLALGDAEANGLLATGDRVVLTAFGGGFTWGSTVLTWPGVRAVTDL